MSYYDEENELLYDSDFIEEGEEAPHWTIRRILYLVIALLMIALLLFYSLWPLINPPQAPAPIPFEPPLVL